MVMAATKLENEDILSDSLEFLGGKPVIDDSKILYGPLVLSLAPKVWSFIIHSRIFISDNLFRKAKCAASSFDDSVRQVVIISIRRTRY